MAVTDVRREGFFRDAVAKPTAIAAAYRRYGKVHGQSLQKRIGKDRACRLLPDSVAKVENRTTPKISRKSNFRRLRRRNTL